LPFWPVTASAGSRDRGGAGAEGRRLRGPAIRIQPRPRSAGLRSETHVRSAAAAIAGGGAGRPTRCCSVLWAILRFDAAPRAKRPEQGLLRLRKELGCLLTCGRLDRICGPGGGLDAEARGDRGARYPDRCASSPGTSISGQPRGYSRAAWTPARGVRHDALRGTRDPAHRPRGLRGGAQARLARVLGRQGERAGNHPAVARRRHRGRPTTIRTVQLST